MSDKKVIAISTARKKVMGQIDVDGVLTDVHQLDFGTMQMLEAAEATSNYLSAVRDAVVALCPSLSAEQVSNMGLDDGRMIVLYAGGGVRAVEAMFPNAVSPETPTSPG
jgi:hypothetical protein